MTTIMEKIDIGDPPVTDCRPSCGATAGNRKANELLVLRDISSQEIYALDLKNRFQNPGPASWSSVKTLPSVRM